VLNAAMLVGVSLSSPTAAWLTRHVRGRHLLQGTAVTEALLRVWTLALLLVDAPLPLVACMVLLTVFLRYTRLGRAIRATAQNPAAARLVGISTGRIAALTFAISAALAALAGALLGPLYYVQPTMGTNLLLKGFAVVIVGGMGSVPGAIVGAFLLGISESVGATILSYGYKDAIGFMLLALTLLFRPGGIFGAVTRA